MAVLNDVAARLASELADLAARRYRHAVVIPGERGDRIVVDLQLMPGGYGGTVLFFVDLALCPLTWIAWNIGIALEQARALPPDTIQGPLRGRLNPRTFEPWWQATVSDLDRTVAVLAPAVRTELAANWLPLLPRDALRQRIRSGGRLPGPGMSGEDALVAQLLCAIEDMPAADRAELVAYFRRREAHGDTELGELADWLGIAFPDAPMAP